MRIDLPSAILSATVSAYWSGVAVTALVNRWRHGRSSGIWPNNGIESYLWPVWLPMVELWNALPWMAVWPHHHSHVGCKALRLIAALLGFGCFIATVACWAQLGRNWSLAVVPGQKPELVRTGPYAVVRHPIYSLSITLMLCSIVVVPKLPMFALAVLHLSFLWTKACSEEQFLHTIHGGAYSDYCRRTGRFFPRWRTVAYLSSLPK